VVALHGASDGTRDHGLLRHLQDVLPGLGIGVATFDRRGEGESTGSPSLGNFELQAQDAAAVARSLGVRRVGLWGYSQGAWGAPIAAELLPETAFLVLVSSAAVTPARQMNFGVAQQMRRADYSSTAVDRAIDLRERFAAWASGTDDPSLGHDLALTEPEPWWELAYLPADLPDATDRASWHAEMSFEPQPVYARIRVPTLLVFGSDDIWVPVEESIANWKSLDLAAPVTTVMIPEATHDMLTPSGEISPDYEHALRDWLSTLKATDSPSGA
jgi:pimeloyl-ACP methyl ester carboxylesterase